MNIAEIKNDNLELCIKVSIDESDVAADIDREFARIAKTAKVDGFRVGKAPVHLLKKKYQDTIRFDITRQKITEAVNKIESERKIKSMSEPEVEELVTADGEGISFTLKYMLLPEFEMPDFSAIEIEQPVLEVSDVEIEAAIKSIVQQHKKYDIEISDLSANGDQVIIDSDGYIDDVAFDGGKLRGTKVILGQAKFIPGFEEQLINVKAGDEVKINVTFPENYGVKELAGKDAEFRTLVISVHRASEVEVNDEFAKSVGAEDLVDLRKKISNDISNFYSADVRVCMKKTLFDKLDEILDFPIPQKLLINEKSSIAHQMKQMEKDHVHDEHCDHDHDNLDDETERNKIAERRVRIGLMIAEYIKLNSIQITQEDLNKAMFERAREFPGYEQQFLELLLKNKNMLKEMRGPVLEDKAVDAMFAQVKMVQKQYTKAELENWINQQ